VLVVGEFLLWRENPIGLSKVVLVQALNLPADLLNGISIDLHFQEILGVLTQDSPMEIIEDSSWFLLVPLDGSSVEGFALRDRSSLELESRFLQPLTGTILHNVQRDVFLVGTHLHSKDQPFSTEKLSLILVRGDLRVEDIGLAQELDRLIQVLIHLLHLLVRLSDSKVLRFPSVEIREARVLLIVLDLGHMGLLHLLP